MRPLVHAAVEKLRAARDLDEERAYAILRDCAMRRRLSMEQVAAMFLGGAEPLPEVG
jgi:AmiR/NasT family two-component response regulator